MKTIAGTISVETSSHSGSATVTSRIVAFAKNFRWRLARQRTRIALGELTDDQLRDVGLTRDQAEREATRSPFSD